MIRVYTTRLKNYNAIKLVLNNANGNGVPCLLNTHFLFQAHKPIPTVYL